MLNYNTNIVSLGYSCETATFLQKQQVRTVPSVFDRMATPMWAVTQLVSNNFEGFLDNVESMSIFEKNPEKWLVDTRYYTRLFPKILDSPQFAKYKTVQLERAQKFFTNLAAAAAANSSVLFVRTEEPSSYADLGKRIAYPQYATQYEQSEYAWLQQFSQSIKAIYPTLQFQILFISSKGAFTDQANNIVGIGSIAGEANFRRPNIATLMERNIAHHATHLMGAMKPKFFVAPVIPAPPKAQPPPTPAAPPTPKKPAYVPLNAYRHFYHF